MTSFALASCTSTRRSCIYIYLCIYIYINYKCVYIYMCTRILSTVGVFFIFGSKQTFLGKVLRCFLAPERRHRWNLRQRWRTVIQLNAFVQLMSFLFDSEHAGYPFGIVYCTQDVWVLHNSGKTQWQCSLKRAMQSKASILYWSLLPINHFWRKTELQP